MHTWLSKWMLTRRARPLFLRQGPGEYEIGSSLSTVGGKFTGQRHARELCGGISVDDKQLAPARGYYDPHPSMSTRAATIAPYKPKSELEWHLARHSKIPGTHALPAISGRPASQRPAARRVHGFC